MHSSLFFRLFPPPKFMIMKHVGLEISDDALHYLEYRPTGHGQVIKSFSVADLPANVIDGGDIKDDKALIAALSACRAKNGFSYVKVSIPEEKAYLFLTEVTDAELASIEQHIEFKLEENVPLSGADAVFYYDVIPRAPGATTTKVSVSVVPRAYVEHHIEILGAAGLRPVAFEVAPKAIARAIIPREARGSQLIVHIMNRKTGMYIVSNGVVCFTSTWGTGSRSLPADSHPSYTALLSAEINRVYTYWASHGATSGSAIDQILLLGHDAAQYENDLQNIIPDISVATHIANIWQNAFSIEHYIPPLNRNQSLDFAVVAGLALLN